VIEGKECRNPQTGPFKVELATWTKVNYLTPLSLNFEPSEDFLALLNKSTHNFQMNTDDYHEKLLTVSYQDQ
jgi:capsule polysaccharide modification protein KpsS